MHSMECATNRINRALARFESKLYDTLYLEKGSTLTSSRFQRLENLKRRCIMYNLQVSEIRILVLLRACQISSRMVSK